MKSFAELIPAVLDTRTRTREREGRGPAADSLAGRRLQAQIIPVLAENFRKALKAGSEWAPPRGLEQVLRRLKPDQYAALAVRVLLNQVYGRPQKRSRRALKPSIELRRRLGRMVRD